MRTMFGRDARTEPGDPAAAPRLSIPVGMRVGTYVVERVLGEGGMGVVVAARHPTLGDTVAIKLLHPRNADRSQRERLEREARATFRIRSEHVVRVLGVERLEGTDTPYVVMEMLEGQDLAAVLAERGPLPFREVVDLVIQICEGVGAAHALGIVHRDLKPSNFFVCPRSDGSPLVKILDFGISKTPLDGSFGDANLTESRAVFGSPTYMSPEQIRSAKYVDARADVWSIGVATFELLTGKLPFVADNVGGLLASIVSDPPFRPSSFVELPAPLEEAVLACLEKDPARRIGSVADLAQRLMPFASPEAALLAERVARGARVSMGPPAAVAAAPSTPPSARGDAPPSSADQLAFGARSTHADVGPVPRARALLPFALAGAAVAGLGLVAAMGLLASRGTRPAVFGGPASSATAPSAETPAPPTASASALVPANGAPSASTPPVRTQAPARPRAPAILGTPAASSAKVDAPVVAPHEPRAPGLELDSRH